MRFEAKKYRAQTYQIAGFAMMTPLGSLVLRIFNEEIKELTPSFVILLVIAIILFLIGIMIIYMGEFHIKEV